MKKISICIGTRPEIIKMAPVIRALKAKGCFYEFIHSNQHYSKEMDADIIGDLRLDPPHLNLGVGSMSHAAQTGRIMEALEKHFLKQRPDFVLVHGDTNTTLAGAVAAKKMGIPIGHVEAGLRSFDQRMPEEVNRILVDRISDIHFAPTEIAKKNLTNEGFDEVSIEVCGNTVADALKEHLAYTSDSFVYDRMGVVSGDYILATAHRPENVDSLANLTSLLDLLEHASRALDLDIILPLHPRTKKNLERYGLELSNRIRVSDPVGYIDMLALINGAALVMTDSGGIQEEAYILERPLITMRDSTERPETLSANFIVKFDPAQFDRAWQAFVSGSVSWEQPFGTGNASNKIVDRILNFDLYE